MLPLLIFPASGSYHCTVVCHAMMNSTKKLQSKRPKMMYRYFICCDFLISSTCWHCEDSARSLKNVARLICLGKQLLERLSVNRPSLSVDRAVFHSRDEHSVDPFSNWKPDATRSFRDHLAAKHKGCCTTRSIKNCCWSQRRYLSERQRIAIAQQKTALLR